MRNTTVRGLTLIELLMVVAIILLATAIVLPTLRQSRAGAYSANCTSNLRQMGVGLLLYMEDNSGPPLSYDLGFLPATGTVGRCPSDTHEGRFSLYHECDGRKRFVVDQSYFHPFGPVTFLWDAVRNLDQNPGLLACLEHGEKTAHYRPGRVCRLNLFMNDGKIIRFRVGRFGQSHTLSNRKGFRRSIAWQVLRLYQAVHRRTPPILGVGSGLGSGLLFGRFG